MAKFNLKAIGGVIKDIALTTGGLAAGRMLNKVLSEQQGMNDVVRTGILVGGGSFIGTLKNPMFKSIGVGIGTYGAYGFLREKMFDENDGGVYGLPEVIAPVMDIPQISGTEYLVNFADTQGTLVNG